MCYHDVMTSAARKLYQEALSLPDVDRESLASLLLESLSSGVDGAPEDRRHRDPSGVTDRRPPTIDDRKREDAWRRSNRDFLQTHFAAKWVVLEGEEIVAHGENAAQAVEKARAKGVAVPFVFYVEPPRQPGVVRIGL